MSEKGILLNRAHFELDLEAYADRFAILQIKYEEPEQIKNALTCLNKYATIKARGYDADERAFVVLCDGRDEVDAILKDMNAVVLMDAAVERSVHNVPKVLLFELLNLGQKSVQAQDSEEDDGGEKEQSYSNMDGSLFIFHSKEHEGDQIITLKLKYRRAKHCLYFGDCAIDLKATSFTNYALKDKMRFRHRTPESYPKYLLDENGFMRLSTGSVRKGQKVYIQHGYRLFDKAGIPFCSVAGTKEFDDSKVGRLRRSMRRLSVQYPEIITRLELHRTDKFDGHKMAKIYDQDKGFANYLPTLCEGKPIRIIDRAMSEESRGIISCLIRDYAELGFKVSEGEEIKPNQFNIVIVDGDKKDPEHKTYTDAPVQHTSVKKLKWPYLDRKQDIHSRFGGAGIKSQLYTLITNLIIKDDVQRRRQSFLGWLQDNIFEEKLSRRWYFIDRYRIPNPNPGTRMGATYGKMAMLTVDTDMSTEYRTYEEDELDSRWLESCWHIFDSNRPGLKGVISDGHNIYALVGTDVYMIPELDKLRDKLKNNPIKTNEKTGKQYQTSGGIRTKGDYENYLKACTDIRYYVEEETGDVCYFVGIRGDGMNSGLQWAANLHRAELVSGDEPMPTELLELMLAPMVRFMGMSVSPYFFKYLHEYERMNGLDEQDLEPDEDDQGEYIDPKQTRIDDYF